MGIAYRDRTEDSRKIAQINGIVERIAVSLRKWITPKVGIWTICCRTRTTCGVSPNSAEVVKSTIFRNCRQEPSHLLRSILCRDHWFYPIVDTFLQ